jgi:arylsulfatase A-like enzyme
MPQEYLDMYDPDKIPLPENFMPEHPFDNGELRIRDELLAPFPRTPEVIRRHIAEYYAMITHADAAIGRVIDALKQTGQYENTIIVFSGDNGLAVGRHGLMGKQNLYEHSVHVPLIMCGPGIPKDNRTGGFCYLIDIYPTLCDLVGAPIPDSVEGQSLVPLMKDEQKQIRETLYFTYKDVQRGVRDERWKLIEYHVEGKKTRQLFDLESDPSELNNLVDEPACKQHVDRLSDALTKWRDDLDDVEGPCGSYWDI